MPLQADKVTDGPDMSFPKLLSPAGALRSCQTALLNGVQLDGIPRTRLWRPPTGCGFPTGHERRVRIPKGSASMKGGKWQWMLL